MLPGGNVRSVLTPFDVDTSVPDDVGLWTGFSGSVVRDTHDRLIGLVAQVRPDREQRRLLVLPVEVLASDPGFAAAAGRVGLDPVIEDHDAPLWRLAVDPRTLSAAGTPEIAADIKDLEALGVHVSAPGVAVSSLGYVKRDIDDAELGPSLASAAAGGSRLVLVVGDSAAGKSRSAYEAIRRDDKLHSWRIVVPVENGIDHLIGASTSWRETVLWLDDLDKHLSRGLDVGALRQILAAAADVVIVATMRSSQLRVRQSELADPAWAFLTSHGQVAQVELPAQFSEDELASAQSQFSDRALLDALADGTGLGEWLVAGPELIKKLTHLTELDRALANTVIAWYRTGRSARSMPRSCGLKRFRPGSGKSCGSGRTTTRSCSSPGRPRASASR
jgi:hypothetical protein